jgi:hypothetical protein
VSDWLKSKVETFEEGQVIYNEGDSATAFFVIRSGEVSLSARDRTKEDIVVSEDQPGSHFGAGALHVAEVKRRVATATAMSQVVCLRLISSDWKATWTPVTHGMAIDMFKAADTDGSGEIVRSELVKQLNDRFQETANSELAHDGADALMSVLDKDGDGQITVDEFEKNLRAVPEDDFMPSAESEQGNASVAMQLPPDQNGGETRSPHPPPPRESQPVAPKVEDRTPLLPGHHQAADQALSGTCSYYHVNPSTGVREAFSAADNIAIYEAQRGGGTATVQVQLSGGMGGSSSSSMPPVQVRFADMGSTISIWDPTRRFIPEESRAHLHLLMWRHRTALLFASDNS